MYYKEKAKEILLALSKAICGEDDPGEFVEDPYIKVVSNILSNTIHEKIEGKTRQEQIDNLAEILSIRDKSFSTYHETAKYILYLMDEADGVGYERGRRERLQGKEGSIGYEVDLILRKIRKDLSFLIYDYVYNNKKIND